MQIFLFYIVITIFEFKIQNISEELKDVFDRADYLLYQPSPHRAATKATCNIDKLLLKLTPDIQRCYSRSYLHKLIDVRPTCPSDTGTLRTPVRARYRLPQL